jgi:hypothetical protein
VVLVQREAFGGIALKRHKRFQEFLASDEMLSAVQQEYS